ncbi:hypothetical protein [Pseudokineococcus sp. 1T1Z-3]|uniref:hypothetical protein n=1 Tax=Pseudokineococcus sp. 1T1Z-3 TaxID=3132745 RepID=UPI0030A94B80
MCAGLLLGCSSGPRVPAGFPHPEDLGAPPDVHVYAGDQLNDLGVCPFDVEVVGGLGSFRGAQVVYLSDTRVVAVLLSDLTDAERAQDLVAEVQDSTGPCSREHNTLADDPMMAATIAHATGVQPDDVTVQRSLWYDVVDLSTVVRRSGRSVVSLGDGRLVMVTMSDEPDGQDPDDLAQITTTAVTSARTIDDVPDHDDIPDFDDR